MTTNFKSILNAIWKIGVGIIALVVLCFAGILSYIWYDKTHGRAYSEDHNLSRTIEVLTFENDRARVKDLKTGRYVTPTLKWVAEQPPRDSLTVYCDVHGNRGYINCNTGKIAIPAEKAQYRRAWYFSEGVAFVILHDSDSLSIIDHSGRIIARNVALYEYGEAFIFNGGVCVAGENGLYGMLAKDGTWAVEPKYSKIDIPNAVGYRIAVDEEGYWLFDSDLNLVFDEPYDNMDYAFGCDPGTGSLYISKNHVKQLVNYDGTVVEPFVVDLTNDLMYMTRFNEIDPNEYGISLDVMEYQVDDWCGLMDRHTGKIITPAIYNDFEMLSEDLIRAELGSGSESVILDKSSRTVTQACCNSRSQ